MPLKRSRISWRKCRHKAGVTLLLAAFVLSFISVPVASTSPGISEAINEYVQGNDEQARDMFAEILRQNPDEPRARDFYKDLGGNPDQYQTSEEDVRSGDTSESRTGDFDFSAEQEEPATEVEEEADEEETSLPDERESVPEEVDDIESVEGEAMAYDTSEVEVVGEPLAEIEAEDLDTDAVPEFDPLEEDELDGVESEEREAEELEEDESKETKRFYTEEPVSPPTGMEVIRGVEVESFDDFARVTIEATGGVNYLTSRIFNPAMIVIDIPNTIPDLPESPLSVGMHNVRRIRHSQYRVEPVKTTRIVVDLDEWVDNYEIYRVSPGNKIIVDIYDEEEEPPEVEPTVVDPDTPLEELPEEVKEQIKAISGADQELKVTEEAPEPLAVEVRDEDGESLNEKTVVFEVIEGKGLLGEEERQFSEKYEIKTDEQGRAELKFEAKEQAGPVVIKAHIPELELSKYFNLTVNPSEPVELVKISGDQQEAQMGSALREPLKVEARDQYGNPVPGVRVHFVDKSGKGAFLIDRSRDDLAPETIETKLTTGSDGRAVVDSYRVPSDKRTVRITAQTEEGLTVEFNLWSRTKMIDLKFPGPVNLEHVINSISFAAGWNIVIPPEVDGRPLADMEVVINLDEVSALRALDTVLAMHNLARVSDGNIIRIVSPGQVRREGAPVVDPEEVELHPGSNMITVKYPLAFLDEPGDLAGDLQAALMSEQSSIFSDDRRNAIVITDYARNQRQLKKVIEGIDQPDERFEVTVIRLQYRDPQRLRDEIEELLPTGRGNIVPNEATNSLLIYSDPTLLSQIEQLLDTLDAPGVISDHFQIVEMEGYDVDQIANQITTILGGQAIDLDEIDVDVDIEDPADLEELRIEREIEDLLNQVTIIPVETLESILVFAPPEIQEIAIEMMEALKRRPGEYIDDRHWRWVSVHNIHFDEAASLIDRMGGITIQTTLPDQGAFLLSSTEGAYLDRLQEFIDEIDRDIDVDDGREIITYTPRQVEPDQLGDDLEDYYADMHEFYDDDLEERPRVLYAEEDLLVLVVSQNEARFIRRLLEKLEEMATVEHEVLTYSPRFVDASDLASELDDRNIGRILYEGDRRFSILIPKDNIEYYRELIQEVDSPQFVTNVFQLRNTRAEEIVETLQDAGDHADFTVSFSADEPTNTIIYSAPENIVSQVENLIEQLDQWQRQVFIEGIILEYTMSEGEEFGTEWIFDDEGGVLEDGDLLEQTSVGFDGSEFTAILRRDQFEGILSFLEREREAEVMAKPQISAINNREASFKYGTVDRVPQRVGPPDDREITWLDVQALIELTVTPTITRDRFVRLDLLMTKDDEAPGGEGVRTEERSLQNTVLVRDGHTVVLGGLIEDEVIIEEQGVPLLREIPVFGNLFRSTSETVNKNELILFLTPHVIEDPSEAERTTRMVSDQLHQITPVPINLNVDGVHRISRFEGLAESEEERERIARQIIDFREEVGPFLSLDDVLRVPAIDNRLLSELLAHEVKLEVDINTISADDLMNIKNIDPDAAHALIEKRREIEMFRELETPRKLLIEHGVDPDFYDEYLEPMFTITSPALDRRDFEPPEPDREEVGEELEELDDLEEDELNNDRREQLPDLDQF